MSHIKNALHSVSSSYVLGNAMHSVTSAFKHMSHFNLSHVRCNMLHVNVATLQRCMSHVIYYMPEMPCILFRVLSNIIMSHVNLSHVTIITCRISHVTCHTLHVLGNAMHSVPSAFNLCHISTCHMSHVTFHMSHVTCHMSYMSNAYVDPLDMLINFSFHVYAQK